MTAQPRGWDDHLDHQLAQLEREGLRRRLVAVEKEAPPYVVRDGRRLVSFASNDYLGLASHPAVKKAAARAAQRAAGSTASRLVSGGDAAYHALEEKIARHKRTEAALVMGSGYLANLGAIRALAGRGDAVFGDRLNHASAVEGCLLSGAEFHRYEHLDTASLAEMLDSAGDVRKLVVTETVFGMAGDAAPLAEIVELTERHGAALMVDEAHAVGVFGPHGEGLAYELGVAESIELHMGTFGKAFGVYGAYLAGSRRWIEFLVNRCRPFVYATALPPAVIGAIGAAIELVEQAHEQRAHIRAMSERMRNGLKELGIVTAGRTQIVPVLVGGSTEAVGASARLQERGIMVPAIRPPTVPPAMACLRFSITSAHLPEHIDAAVAAVGEVSGPD